jgi:hypothetical protein
MNIFSRLMLLMFLLQLSTVVLPSKGSQLGPLLLLGAFGVFFLIGEQFEKHPDDF